MSVNNGVITAPVSIYDVQRALGSSIPDLGTLCVASTINKWAKYKPIKYPTVKILTDAQRLSRLYGFHDPDGNIIPVYQSMSAMNMAIANGNAEWVYTKPAGGLTSPYRLTDFDKYVHSLSGWGGFNNKWDLCLGGTIVINRRCSDNMEVKAGDVVAFNMEFDSDGELGYGDLLKLDDFLNWSPDGYTGYFSEWYGGLLFHDTTIGTNHKCILDSTPIGSQSSPGIGIYNQIQGSGAAMLRDNSTYRVIPFAIAPWSGMPSGWTDGDLGTGKRIISFNGASFYIRKSSSEETFYNNLSLLCTSFVQSNGQTTVQISSTNNRGSAYTLREFYLLLVSEKSYDTYDNPWEVGWDNQTDVAYGTTTYYSQIVNDNCYTAASGTARKRYARSVRVPVTTIPTGTNVLATVTIPAIGDDYGTFDIDHSVFYCLDFTENVTSQGSRIVM